MKIVIYPDVDIWRFVLTGLSDREDVRLFPLNEYCNLFQKLVRKQNCLVSAPSWMVIGEELRRNLSQLHSGDSVILCEYTDIPLVSALAQVIPVGVSRHLWYWNHQSPSPSLSQRIKRVQCLGFQITTYDEQNANDFGLHWHPQFFPIAKVQQDYSALHDISFDFFFAGYKKNREPEITALCQSLSSYHCKFITVRTTQEYVPFATYLQLAAQSRCIVEIVKPGDPACTLRPLEAIALHRKLLTNNPHIRQYSFYHPDNIFIFGEDDLSELPHFLDTPFHILPDEVLTTYDINTWIDSFK